MRSPSLLLPLALLLCLAVLIAAARPDKPYRSPSYTLHNRKLQLAAALDSAAIDPVWMLGCIADGAYSVEMTIAGQGPFVMMFDTGSTTTAVLSTLCHNDTECASDLGNRLNVSEGVSDGRLVGPYGNTSVDFGASGFSGPLYDATISLTGTPHSLDTVVRFVPIAAARYFLNSSWYCPFDTHSKGHDFSVGIVGAGLPSPRLGDGSTDWLVAFFDQHPKQPREFTYELCPMDAGRLWMGEYDGDEEFACSPNVGATQWKVQTCGLTLTSHVNKSTTVLGVRDDFGVCGSAGEFEQCTLVDTGTTQTLLPDPVYQQFVAALRSDPAYIAAFGTSNDPYDPTLSMYATQCATSNVSMHELRRQLPTVHFQLSNSSPVGGNGTCTANHSLAMPGVDGYLSRLTAPHSQHPLYCAFVGSSGGPPVPVPTPRFALLGATFMQTYIIKQVLNHTAEEAAQICFARSTGCGERTGGTSSTLATDTS